MFKKLSLAALLGTISAQQVLVLNTSQLQALLELQGDLAATQATEPAIVPTPSDAVAPVSQPDAEAEEPATPPAVAPEKLSVMEMYDRSLQWADNIVKHVADLENLIRTSDAFVTRNTNIFAQHGNGTLTKAFRVMSQVVVDTKNTLRDVEAYASQIRNRLGDANDYLQMIDIPKGAAPTADDMEILDMVMQSIREALGYSVNTTKTIRSDFYKIHLDLVDLGAHIKIMISQVATNLNETTAALQETIVAGEARIEALMKEDQNCGRSGIDMLLSRKSECKKIESTLKMYKEQVDENQKKMDAFAGSYPILQALKGIDQFMKTSETQNFEHQISAFMKEMEGQSLLPAMPEPTMLATKLTSTVEKATSVEKEAAKTALVLQTMFDQTVGRQRFARQLQNMIWSK